MTTIENDYLKISIHAKGAELCSVYNKSTGTEHLWQADPNIWGWHAPNLFPVVGGLIDNKLKVDGKLYDMPRHGFTRISETLLLESDAVSAKFSLPNSDHTLAIYPYKFDYQVHYDLIDNALRITYKVINHDTKTVYFSVGAHPAFNVPFHPGEKYEDYYVEFETEEKLVTHLLSKEGFFNGETHPVPLKHKKLYLTRELFLEDALVFKNILSKEVTIGSDKHDQKITVEYPHFYYLGLWAKPKGDFLCIEPWLGCADSVGLQVDISKKELIQNVKQGHVFEAAFFITV